MQMNRLIQLYPWQIHGTKASSGAFTATIMSKLMSTCLIQQRSQMNQKWRSHWSEVCLISHSVWQTARTIRQRRLIGGSRKRTVGACCLSIPSWTLRMNCMLRWMQRVRSKVRVIAKRTLMGCRSMNKHNRSAPLILSRRRPRRRKMSSSSNPTSVSGPSLWRKI